MSLECDSILKPVCVLAVNILRLVFFPLVVTGTSSYLNDLVFITGSFSTELSAAGAALPAETDPMLCAEALAAARAGSSKPRSLREYFIRSPFPVEPQHYTPGEESRETGHWRQDRRRQRRLDLTRRQLVQELDMRSHGAVQSFDLGVFRIDQVVFIRRVCAVPVP